MPLSQYCRLDREAGEMMPVSMKYLEKNKYVAI